MKLVLLGTGTPNACYNASGPSSAIIVNHKAYLIDFGPGVIRQCAKAYHNGIKELRPDLVDIAFCTHLHSDHTAGYPDLIFTPWVLERSKPLQVYGPTGLKHMTKHIHEAYKEDINFRLYGFEKADPNGYKVDVQEITEEGIVYQDDNVHVIAFPVNHGTLPSFAYKFISDEGSIVISGDTSPTETMERYCKDCDILLHEAEYTAGLKDREPKWQKYHQEVHTTAVDLGRLVQKGQPRQVVTYHRIYHLDMLADPVLIDQEVNKRNDLIIEEIRSSGYQGPITNGKDLDVFSIDRK